MRYLALALWLASGPDLQPATQDPPAPPTPASPAQPAPAPSAPAPAIPAAATPATAAPTTGAPRAIRAIAARLAVPPAVSRPAAFPRETADYRVTFGILGQVAQATITYTPDTTAGPMAGKVVRAVGAGGGAVLGFGETQKRIESEFEAGSIAARRWTTVRAGGGKVTVDSAEQPRAGSLSLLRKKTGEADLTEGFSRNAPVMDALSFLFRLRTALPTAPTVYEVLDGRALWVARVSPARPDPDDEKLVRVDGKIDPIYWSGSPDPERKSHAFSLFFTRDAYHTPVRLVVPSGLGEFRAELSRLERAEPDLDQIFARRASCARFLGRAICGGILFPGPKRPTSP